MVDLFASVVGGDQQNVTTVLALLKDKYGYDFHAPDAFDVILQANAFYEIDFDKGYKIVKPFSANPPAVFKNSYPLSGGNHAIVDPLEADEFAGQNPNWTRLTPEQIEKEISWEQY